MSLTSVDALTEILSIFHVIQHNVNFFDWIW
jgi:hypothetical protein